MAELFHQVEAFEDSLYHPHQPILMTGMPGQNMRMLRGKSLDIHGIFYYPPTRGLWTALLDYTLGNFFYALFASLSQRESSAALGS